MKGVLDLTGTHAERPALLPLDAGEQYRFSFDMGACIGCHSCEVACAEQNGLPVDVAWRRVGEIEGGEYPRTRRFHLSMACNHCLEPTCLSGCPTEAYVKLSNGIVQHLADECIGCGYCTWNCPYEVPVMHPTKRIATKCDMCLPRLEVGDLPACVDACPTRAITVEKVDVAAWRLDHAQADAPNLPPADITLSTTRVVLPRDVPLATFAGDDHRLTPQHPHWPLVAVTLLTQLAVGMVGSALLLDMGSRGGAGSEAGVTRAALAAFAVAALSLVVSLAHLGRPARAYKALRNLRRSWLSREVALFGAFAAAASGFVASRVMLAGGGGSVVSGAAGAAALLIGVAGLYASARLYMVPARPVWNSWRTVATFFFTALAAGPIATLLVADPVVPGGPLRAALPTISGAGLLGQLVVQLTLLAGLVLRQEPEYRGSAVLLVHRFRPLFVLRLVLVVVAMGGLALIVGLEAPRGLVAVLFGVVAIAELVGRYLFYVTVVSMNMPGSFFRGAR